MTVPPLGFRTRVALLTAGAVALAVVLLAGLLFVAATRALVGEVDGALAREASTPLALAQGQGGQQLRAVVDRIRDDDLSSDQLRELLARTRVPGDARRRAPGRGPARPDAALFDLLVDRRDPLGGAAGVTQLVTGDGRALLAELVDAALPVDEVDMAVARGGPPRFRTVRVEGDDVRVHTVNLVEGVALQVARPLDEVTATRSAIARATLVAGMVGVLVAGVAGHVVAGRVVEPVRRLRRTAAEVARTGDLDRSIDVTGDDEIAGLAATFNEMLASLAAARQSQVQLVADASHELRTPLTSLRTNIEVLRLGGLSDADRRALLTDVDAQLAEFGSLVEALVALARGDGAPSSRAVVGLDEVVARAVDAAAARWRDVDLRLSPPHGNTAVLAAEDEVERAVTNLIDNAAKYGAAGGPVEVRVTDGTVVVRDHGPGVRAEDLPHVFERFYRAPEARARPGSGLGLAIVEQVARSHGGDASLAPAPGGGAIATLRLPPVAADGP